MPFKRGIDWNPQTDNKQITLDMLPTGWEEKTLELYNKGGSDVEVRAEVLSISKNLFYNLLKREPKFKETIDFGHELSEAWWQSQGREGLYDTDESEYEDGQIISRKVRRINAQIFKLNMINRFNWGDSYKDLEDKRHSEVVEEVSDGDWFDTIKKKI
jgi:hypothetical protein